MNKNQLLRDWEEVPRNLANELAPPEIEEDDAIDLDDLLAWNDAQRRATFGDAHVAADDARAQAILDAAAHSPHRLANELKARVANDVSKAMCAKGITRAELARRLGKSRAYVTKLLAGGQNLTLESMAQLCEIVGCDIKIELPTHYSELKEAGVAVSQARREIPVVENVTLTRAPRLDLLSGGKGFLRSGLKTSARPLRSRQCERASIGDAAIKAA